jgi:hypothetical protein
VQEANVSEDSGDPELDFDEFEILIRSLMLVCGCQPINARICQHSTSLTTVHKHHEDKQTRSCGLDGSPIELYMWPVTDETSTFSAVSK